jgi:hypothetical protein
MWIDKDQDYWSAVNLQQGLITIEGQEHDLSIVVRYRVTEKMLNRVREVLREHAQSDLLLEAWVGNHLNKDGRIQLIEVMGSGPPRGEHLSQRYVDMVFISVLQSTPLELPDGWDPLVDFKKIGWIPTGGWVPCKERMPLCGPDEIRWVDDQKVEFRIPYTEDAWHQFRQVQTIYDPVGHENHKVRSWYDPNLCGG